MSDRAFLVRPLRFAAILGGALLAGCASVVAPPPAPGPAASAPPPVAAAVEIRARSRWVPVPFTDLPGWDQDRLEEALPALRQGCTRPPPAWAALCRQLPATPGNDNNGYGGASLRDWLQQRLQAYRVEPLDGAPVEGLLTGYFEPQLDASRRRSSAFNVPLYGPPADLASRKPWWTRQQIDTLPAAQAALRGREVAWVASPLDALVLQIQGSGRLLLRPGHAGGGEAQLVRVAYAGTNDQPYKSVGRWLIDNGELKPGEASWPAIRAWAERNPKRVNELLWSNPRVVFFREEPLPDPALGPRGAQGVPLTPGRSIAVDPQSIPYGTPVWLVSTEPLSSTPLRRLVMAQDTGSAITGAVRADYFWGWGATAEAQAGRMKQPLRMWVLWPR
ncbi:MAG: MltA domain-containing protein [Piscinibacter sp.]|nr:MltA domain-containing protein [Piscinibacter sp.]